MAPTRTRQAPKYSVEIDFVDRLVAKRHALEVLRLIHAERLSSERQEEERTVANGSGG